MQMKKIARAAIILGGVLIMALSGCGGNDETQPPVTDRNFIDNPLTLRYDDDIRVNAPQLASILPNEEIARMTTNHGVVYIRFFPDLAPLAVESFIGHSRDGYYDGLTFHRVQDGFMIQGGCPDGDGTGGTTIWGHGIDVERSPQLVHLRGALSMANTGQRNSTGSQFFIVQSSRPPSVTETRLRRELGDDLAEAYIEHGGTQFLDGRHTVFGQVFRGMDVVDTIANVEVELGPGQSWHDEPTSPVSPVIIHSIEIMYYRDLI